MKSATPSMKHHSPYTGIIGLTQAGESPFLCDFFCAFLWPFLGLDLLGSPFFVRRALFVFAICAPLREVFLPVSNVSITSYPAKP
jgi:hypothetical protein